MKSAALLTIVLFSVLLVGCIEDEMSPAFEIPETYLFERDGNSTVSFTGQSQRIAMAEEILTALKNSELTEATIDAMFDHHQGNNDFTIASLNESDKSIRNKTAASSDYFSANTVEASSIKADFDTWIAEQANFVFPNWSSEASAGNAGYIQQAGGGSIRYINGNGLEVNQAFAKSLIGALMTDQALNNYLSRSVLDEGSNKEDNNEEVLESGENYTTMEHKWDEAYGYLYGASQNPANPNLTIGQDDSFLNEYIGQVSNDPDFAEISSTIFNAFVKGRAAIVARKYSIRDLQAEIIRANLSSVLAIRGVYYLQAGKVGLQTATPDMASVFHSLSEAYGFVYSLQFTRNPDTNAPFFSRAEVLELLELIYPTDENNNGFWNVTAADLQTVSETIATKFGFTVAQAASVN